LAIVLKTKLAFFERVSWEMPGLSVFFGILANCGFFFWHIFYITLLYC
jgi:hypothetical protein